MIGRKASAASSAAAELRGFDFRQATALRSISPARSAALRFRAVDMLQTPTPRPTIACSRLPALRDASPTVSELRSNEWRRVPDGAPSGRLTHPSQHALTLAPSPGVRCVLSLPRIEIVAEVPCLGECQRQRMSTICLRTRCQLAAPATVHGRVRETGAAALTVIQFPLHPWTGAISARRTQEQSCRNVSVIWPVRAITSICGQAPRRPASRRWRPGAGGGSSAPSSWADTVDVASSGAREPKECCAEPFRGAVA